jgi:hypothetical protein
MGMEQDGGQSEFYNFIFLAFYVCFTVYLPSIKNVTDEKGKYSLDLSDGSVGPENR